MAKMYALWLLTSLVCGAVAAAIARYKGREPVRWFFVGAGLNVLALAIVSLVSNRASGSRRT